VVPRRSGPAARCRLRLPRTRRAVCGVKTSVASFGRRGARAFGRELVCCRHECGVGRDAVERAIEAVARVPIVELRVDEVATSLRLALVRLQELEDADEHGVVL